jgi:hypothetical protein
MCVKALVIGVCSCFSPLSMHTNNTFKDSIKCVNAMSLFIIARGLMSCKLCYFAGCLAHEGKGEYPLPNYLLHSNSFP